MAIAADIPPELFTDVLFYVCEHAWKLLDLSEDVLSRKEDIANIAACSCTCTYWAYLCRKQLFRRAWIKNYEDMRAFSSLLLSTPKGLRPVSEYLQYVTLAQRVGDRPWIHLLRLQPSLLSLGQSVDIRFHILNSPSDTGAIDTSGCSLSQRLFACLPRTLPSSCLQCDHLIIDKPHFATPRDLTSLLDRFLQRDKLELIDVTWDAQAHFEGDLFTRDSLWIFPSYAYVTVFGSRYTAETAWLAFVTAQRHLSRQRSTIPRTSHYSMLDADHDPVPALQVLPSALQAIWDMSKFLCECHRVPVLQLVRYEKRLVFYGEIHLNSICNLRIGEYKLNRASYDLDLSFYASQAKGTAVTNSSDMTVHCISVLCARIGSTREPSAGSSSTGMQYTMAYPWEGIVALCAAQEGFMQLQLEFGSRDHLVRFMEAQRVALAKLVGRVSLFYAKEGEIHAADFETLAEPELATDFWENGYIF